jgi:meiotic recombination protein SPO11
MRTYKHGSRTLQHEQNVTVPALLWLGVKRKDVFNQTITQPPRAQHILDFPPPWITVHHTAQLTNFDYKANPLSTVDRRKASSLLKALDSLDALDAEGLDLIGELQFMLMLNVKFEIQAVCDGGNMKSWLDERLSHAFMDI